MESKNSKQLLIFKLLLFFLFLLPPYVTIKTGQFPGINPARLIQIYFIIIWMLSYTSSSIFRKKIQSYFRQYKYIVLMIIGMYSVQLYSSLFCSINILPSVANTIMAFISQGFLLFLTIGYVGRKNIGSLIKLMLIFETFIIFISFLEWFQQKPLFSMFTFLNEDSLDAFNTGKFRHGSYRVFSTMPHPLVVAQILLMLLPFNHYYFTTTKRNLIFLINIIATPIVIVMTDSRMGMALYFLYYILYIVSFLSKLLTEKSKFFFRKLFLKVIIISLIATSLLLITKFDYFIAKATDIVASSEGYDESVSSSYARIEQIIIASENVSLFGYGAHGTEDIMENYSLLVMDNYYISILLKSGVLGLILYILMIISIFKLITNGRKSYLLPFFFFYFNFILFTLILSIDYLMNIFYIFLGFLFILLKKDVHSGQL